MEINKISVQKDADIKEAMRNIDKAGIRMSLVLDDKKLIGVVTDGDIRRGILSGLHISENVTKVMNDSPLYVEEGATTEEWRQVASRL